MNREKIILALTDLPDDLILDAQKSPEKTLRPSRAVRIALAACLVMALGVTAYALGRSIRDAARQDLGIRDPDTIPEYTEYASPDDGETGEDVRAELVSALCTGDKLIAYVRLSPVPEDLFQSAGTAMDDAGNFAGWMKGVAEPHGEMSVFDISQVMYEPDTESVLLRIWLSDESLQDFEEVCIPIVYHTIIDGEGETPICTEVTIPVTASDSYTVPAALPVRNRFLDQEGMITEISLNAGYLSVLLTASPLEELCASLGENAYEDITHAYAPDDGDISVFSAVWAYGNMWLVSINELEPPVLHTVQGTDLDTGNMNTRYALLWNGGSGDPSLDCETGLWEFRIAFDTPLVLSDIVSVSFMGEEFTFDD